jgi:hypothetical protein
MGHLMITTVRGNALGNTPQNDISITTQFIITTKNEESNYERCNGLDRCNDDDELLQLEQHR